MLDSFAELVGHLGGGRAVRWADPAAPCTTWLIDSRRVVVPHTSVFFAIRGEHHDGHAFLDDLYARGVRNFVVEVAPDADALPDANVWEVPDAVAAMQAAAAAYRQGLSCPVVGITGSNGKTVVKEWLSQLLSPDHHLGKSPKSYNSQVGVPLSVRGLRPEQTLALLEAGISRPGEMARLENVVRPDVGIFTNLGSAHDEGFASRADKLAEKMALFRRCPVIIYCRDHAPVHDYVRQHYADRTLLGWSAADLSLPFTDGAARENAGHCVALMRHLGLPEATIRARLGWLREVPMRLERKRGRHDCTLVDDSYNNDLAGLRVALDFVRQQPQPLGTARVAILSDLMETGLPDADLCARVATLLREAAVDRLVGIGPVLSAHPAAFAGLDATFYPTTEALLAGLDDRTFRGALVLVKGARAFHFERVTQRLQQQAHGTRLEINLEALAHNLSFYRRRLRPGVRTMVMVKAFAYGSGYAEVAGLLEWQGVDYLAVAYADEGVRLREQGITLPVMVMNPTAATFDKLAEYRLEPELYSPSLWAQYRDFAAAHAVPPVHVKVDTGMRRLGFTPEEVGALGAALRAADVRVASVFTHLAGADEATHDAFSAEQLTRFGAATTALAEALGYAPPRHALNSAGIVRFPDHQYEMVRLGIGLYGVEASGTHPDALTPISRLVTTVSQVKQVRAGETIGYGRHGRLPHHGTIATVAIGYADGFRRALSRGRGYVLVGGQRAPVVGNVCMDMTMVDVTGLDVREGDEVTVFGEGLPLRTLAEQLGTIPYEILTGVSERVKRVYYAA